MLDEQFNELQALRVTASLRNNNKHKTNSDNKAVTYAVESILVLQVEVLNFGTVLQEQLGGIEALAKNGQRKDGDSASRQTVVVVLMVDGSKSGSVSKENLADLVPTEINGVVQGGHFLGVKSISKNERIRRLAFNLRCPSPQS